MGEEPTLGTGAAVGVIGAVGKVTEGVASGKTPGAEGEPIGIGGATEAPDDPDPACRMATAATASAANIASAPAIQYDDFFIFSRGN